MKSLKKLVSDIAYVLVFPILIFLFLALWMLLPVLISEDDPDEWNQEES